MNTPVNTDRISTSDTNEAGLTLIELLSVMVIGLITLMLGFPAIQSFTSNNQLQATSTELVTSLHMARSEAVTRGTPVSACASADGATCATDGDEWVNGWIIFTDSSGTAGIFDADDELLRVITASPDSLTLEGGTASLRYLASGELSI